MEKKVERDQVWKDREANLYVITGKDRGKYTAIKFCNNKLSTKKMFLDAWGSDFESKIMVGFLRYNYIIKDKKIEAINDN